MTRRIIAIALAALTLLLCLALGGTVLALYREGLARRAASGSGAEPIFTQAGVGAALRRLLPLAGLWLATLIAGLATGGAAPARGGASRVKLVPGRMTGTAQTPRVRAIRRALLALALLLIALGIFNGGLNDVLVKAVNICTECIGLG